MHLACNISQFNDNLEESLVYVRDHGIDYVNLNFSPFETTKNETLSQNEINFFKSLKNKADLLDIKFNLINLDESPKNLSKNELQNEINSVYKISQICKIIECHKIGIYLNTIFDTNWQGKVSLHLKSILKTLKQTNIKLLLRLSTPSNLRNLSLLKWNFYNPDIIRNLLAQFPELSLSFSPADCVWLGINYLELLPALISAIDNIEANDIEINRMLLNDSGIFGPIWWQYKLPGLGQLDWRQLLEALKLYEYKHTITIQIDDDFYLKDHQSIQDAFIKSSTFLKKHIK